MGLKTSSHFANPGVNAWASGKTRAMEFARYNLTRPTLLSNLLARAATLNASPPSKFSYFAGSGFAAGVPW